MIQSFKQFLEQTNISGRVKERHKTENERVKSRQEREIDTAKGRDDSMKEREKEREERQKKRENSRLQQTNEEFPWIDVQRSRLWQLRYKKIMADIDARVEDIFGRYNLTHPDDKVPWWIPDKEITPIDIFPAFDDDEY
jgi:hypothetical protein